MDSDWKGRREISAHAAARLDSVLACDEVGCQEVYWDGLTCQWRKAGGEVASTEGMVTFYAVD